MNARTAVLRLIHDDDGSAVAEDVIYDKFPGGERRRVKSAIQGLESAGVLTEHRMFGGEIYWSIAPNLSEAKLRQTLTSVSPGEVADKIIEQSSLFGDPNDARPGGDDVWKNLL